VRCATREEVDGAVAKARAAQPAWAARSFEERAAYMYRLADLSSRATSAMTTGSSSPTS
jgi:acyl-CoA reductase-like NAD-dependent aldehyde dehydrogenase